MVELANKHNVTARATAARLAAVVAFEYATARARSAFGVDAGGVRALPRHVRALLRLRENMSERLISRLQLTVLGLFAALYFLAPRPADAPTHLSFDPVPIALALYGVFTIIRLGIAERGRVPVPLLLISIVIDMGLLIGLIWSFHIHYGQSAPFSLRVPTFSYLFVFIALRALCFDYRLVVVAGVAAMCGWATLVFATVAVGGPATVTRDFVGYMMGRGVLLGAEIDKIATLGIVTLLLAIAVRRTEALLVTAVRETDAKREIGRFLSHGVIDVIQARDLPIEPGEATDRDAAILMLDIRGFTRATQSVEPKELVTALAALHERIVPIVRRHGGVIDKFLGDGIMATFGAILPTEQHAADALNALVLIMAESQIWTETMRTRWPGNGYDVNAAVVAGPIVLATLGSKDRLEYTVIGDAVNMAAKLEKHNKVTGTRALTTAFTMRLAITQGFDPDAIDATWRMQDPVAGAIRPIDVVVLAG